MISKASSLNGRLAIAYHQTNKKENMMNTKLKLDMRKAKQTFVGKCGVEYTLNRHRVANNLGMYATYHTLWAFGEQRNIFAPESTDMTAYKKHLVKHLSQYI